MRKLLRRELSVKRIFYPEPRIVSLLFETTHFSRGLYSTGQSHSPKAVVRGLLPGGLGRRNGEASHVADNVTNLLVFEKAAPGRHEGGFPNPGSALSDNFMEIFVRELAHEFAIRMVGRFNLK